MYYVYILKSLARNYHYIGHTEDLHTRLKSHNAGQVRSSKPYRPLALIYTEAFETRSEAQQREYFFKRGGGNIWLRDYLQAKGLW